MFKDVYGCLRMFEDAIPLEIYKGTSLLALESRKNKWRPSTWAKYPSISVSKIWSRPPKASPRPSQNLESSQNRPQIDPINWFSGSLDRSCGTPRATWRGAKGTRRDAMGARATPLVNLCSCQSLWIQVTNLGFQTVKNLSGNQNVIRLQTFNCKLDALFCAPQKHNKKWCQVRPRKP